MSPNQRLVQFANYREEEVPLPGAILAYLELIKPRVTALVVLTAAAGFYLASFGSTDLWVLLATVLGTGLLAGGTAVLNQFMEREADGRMRRTAARPLPSGRIPPRAALHFGMLLISTGTILLLVSTNLLTAFLGWLTSVVYLLVYTPLKQRTPWCTLIGAFPGAIPPLMGWTAVRGELSWDGIVLFGILFSWQFPHFLAIAWLYREDYERGGFQMLPSGDDAGRLSGLLILGFSLLLLVFSLAPAVTGLAGTLYLTAAVLLGAYFVFHSVRLAKLPSLVFARKVLRASVFYLPLLLLFLTLGKTP